MSFNDLKKKSGSKGLAAIQEKLDQINDKDKGKFKPDPRFWKLDTGKDGVGSAVIRFLPECDGENDKFVKLLQYSFKAAGGWYIENSLKNIGRPDPVDDLFGKLWNSGIEANKEKAKKLKRKTTYISNILVVKDPAHPDNEGKVFLFSYGQQIFDIVNSALFPEQDDLDEEKKVGVNVFCPWEGANLKLRSKIGENKQINYLSSEFSAPTPILGGADEKIKALWQSQNKLAEFTAPESFKSYEDLQKRLDRVLGLSLPANGNATVDNVEKVAAKTAAKQEKAEAPEVETNETDSEDVDSDLSYLQSLAGEQD